MTNKFTDSAISRLEHGDCLEIMREIPDNYFDITLTDPPFGMQFQSNYRQTKHKEIANDDNLDWLPEFAKEIDRINKPDAHLYLFCSHHFVEVFKMELQKYRKVKNILIWEKNNTGMGDLDGDYAPKYEMVLFCSSGERKLNNGRSPNIIKATRTGNDLHPTQKPVDLMSFLLGKSAAPGDKIFDPFAGSGSTLVAAKSLDLDWFGGEIDREHYETAQQRLKAVQGSLF